MNMLLPRDAASPIPVTFCFTSGGPANGWFVVKYSPLKGTTFVFSDCDFSVCFVVVLLISFRHAESKKHNAESISTGLSGFIIDALSLKEPFIIFFVNKIALANSQVNHLFE